MTGRAQVGVDPVIGLGWLRGTYQGDSAAVLGLLSSRVGAVAERDYGTRFYERSATVGDGLALVAWGPRSAANRPSEVMFDVGQRALDALGWAGCCELVGELMVLGARFSRVDAYYDDLARVVDPSEVLAAFRAGQAVSHTQRSRSIDDSDGSFTAYIGSRSSDAFLRVYRKWVESGDPAAGVRWEMETHGERADAFLMALTAGQRVGEVFMGLLRGLVDFRDRRGQAHGERAPLLPWWALLVGSAARVRLAAAVRVDSLAARVKWLAGQVAPTLATAYVAYGEDWVRSLLDAGVRRMNPRAWEVARCATG